MFPGERVTGNIFISYRRTDSAAYAGRICDHLSTVFGADRVFMDVDDVAPGQEFARVIGNTIAACDVLLVVIGPGWLETLRERSDAQQQDYVFYEIEAALSRGIALVPVLVGGAGMPQASGLPDRLAPLALYQAAELRDSTFREDCTRLANSLGLPAARDKSNVQPKTGRRKTFVLAGLAAPFVLIVLAVWTAIGPRGEGQAHKAEINALLATARVQADRTEYESAFHTCRNLLKIDPLNPAALDLQTDIAMRWLQNFRVVVSEGSKAEDIAGPRLAEILMVLDAALARTKLQGQRAADVLAHLGWAHWLNQHLAYKEFGTAAERDLRHALRIDPSNVFAHAMLGNWIIQTNGDISEALRHFDLAIQTNEERPLVRGLQLGAMTYNPHPELRSALIRVVDEMRRNGEPLNDLYRRRILTAYNPAVNTVEELNQSLAAVPPRDAWETYLWLDNGHSQESEQRMRSEFIHASILEIGGQRADALAAFEKLRQDLKDRGYDGRIVHHVSEAVRRLSK